MKPVTKTAWWKRVFERTAAGCYNLLRLMIERLFPWPFVALVIVGLLVGSGVAWKIVIPNWIEIMAGESELNEASDTSHAETLLDSGDT